MSKEDYNGKLAILIQEKIINSDLTFNTNNLIRLYGNCFTLDLDESHRVIFKLGHDGVGLRSMSLLEKVVVNKKESYQRELVTFDVHKVNDILGEGFVENIVSICVYIELEFQRQLKEEALMAEKNLISKFVNEIEMGKD